MEQSAAIRNNRTADWQRSEIVAICSPLHCVSSYRRATITAREIHCTSIKHKQIMNWSKTITKLYESESQSSRCWLTKIQSLTWLSQLVSMLVYRRPTADPWDPSACCQTTWQGQRPRRESPGCPCGTHWTSTASTETQTPVMTGVHRNQHKK